LCFLDALPPGTVLVQQFRNPLRQIRSILSSGLIDKRVVLEPYRDRGVEGACEFFCNCHRRLEALGPVVVHKVEKPAWPAIFALLGRECPDADLIERRSDHALRRMKKRRFEHIGWHDLTDEARDMAEAQGYEIGVLADG
jgi:hypothetical protein